MRVGLHRLPGDQRLDDGGHRRQRDPDHHPGRWSASCSSSSGWATRTPRPWSPGLHGSYARPPARIIIPHSFINLLYQSTIAILLLVGFESVTALGAEAIRPEKDIQRGVLLSPASSRAASATCSSTSRPTSPWATPPSPPPPFRRPDRRQRSRPAATPPPAASTAPIGDMLKTVGNKMLGNTGNDHRPDRGRDRAAGPDRHHPGLPQHRGPGHLRHGQGQGDARHPRPAARQVRHTPRRRRRS